MDEGAQKNLQQKLGVQGWDDLTESKGKDLLKKVESIEINKEEWDYLKAVVPGFYSVATAGLTSISSVTASVTSVQSEAMKVMQEGIRAAKEIALKSDDPEVHKHALSSIDGAYDRIERMNKDNNSWGGVVVTALVGILSGVIYFATGGKGRA